MQGRGAGENNRCVLLAERLQQPSNKTLLACKVQICRKEPGSKLYHVLRVWDLGRSVEACVAGIAVASHSPRADEVCLLISLDEALVAGDIARPLLRHAEADVEAGSLELGGNVDTVGGSDFESREADSKDHGDWLAVLVDVG